MDGWSIVHKRGAAAAADGDDAVTSCDVDDAARLVLVWLTASVGARGCCDVWPQAAVKSNSTPAHQTSANVDNSAPRGSYHHSRCPHSIRDPPWPRPRPCWPRCRRSVPSVWPRCSLSSTSCVCSETISWSGALWVRGRERSQCAGDASSNGWSEILSRAPEFGSECTSDAFSSARSRNLQRHPSRRQSWRLWIDSVLETMSPLTDRL